MAAKLGVGLGWVVVVVLGFLAVIQLLGDDGGSTVTIFAAAMTPLTYLPAYAVLVGAAVTRRWLMTGTALAIVVVQLVWVLPVIFAGGGHGPVELRVAESNIYYLNRDGVAAAHDILAQHPGIVVIGGVSPTNLPALQSTFAADLPHHVAIPRVTATGTGVWSRYPVKAVRDRRTEGLPLQEVDVMLPAGPLRVYAVHLQGPTVSGAEAWRDQLKRVALIVATRPVRSIVAGDFNATRWNEEFRHITATGLTDARSGGDWWEPTFPQAIWHLPAVLPIDHVLVPRGIDAVGSSTFSVTGSEHRALSVQLGGALLNPTRS